MTKKKRGNVNPKRSRKPNKVEVEYIVESIVDRRINSQGVIEYLLKWQGFTHDDNTWEPADNCACPELIEEFEKQVSRKRDDDVDLELTDGEADSDRDAGKNSHGRIDNDSETETEITERPGPASRKNRSNGAQAIYKDDTTDDESKDDTMEVDRENSFSKELTLEDSLDSLEFASKFYNKENDASKIQPEFEVEDDDDGKRSDKRDPPRDKFDAIIAKTASTIIPSTSPYENRPVAEKILKAGLLKDGKIHFIVKVEGLTEPQRYEAGDAYKLFPQEVISYFQTRIRWQ